MDARRAAIKEAIEKTVELVRLGKLDKLDFNDVDRQILALVGDSVPNLTSDEIREAMLEWADERADAKLKRYGERQVLNAGEFDDALETYASGEAYSAETLFEAAGMVCGSTMPIDPKSALAIAELTGTRDEIIDYDDAGRAIRRWFAACWEPGQRH